MMAAKLLASIAFNPDTVDPRETLWQLGLWSTFNIGGAVLMFLVLLISLWIPNLRRLPLLLNLEFLITASCASGSILIWTGHALNKSPPTALCLFNAAITISNVPAAGFAALCLTISVWAQAMLSNYPASRILRILSSTSMLIIIPYLFAFPLFLVSIIYLTRHKSELYRSPFNCSFTNTPLHTVGSITGASSTFFVLVFSAWTLFIVARARWRTRAVRTTSTGPGSTGRAHRRLLIRVLAFGGCVSAAFIAGIIQIMVGFSAVYPDLVVAAVFGSASLIFGSQKDIFRFIRCAGSGVSSQSRSGTSARGRSTNGPVVSVDVVTLSTISQGSGDFVMDSTGEETEPDTPGAKERGADNNRVWEVKRTPSAHMLSNA